MMNLANLGANLFAVNPLLGAGAMGASFLADQAIARDQQQNQLASLAQQNQNAMALAPNPYAGANLPGFRQGGQTPPKRKQFEERLYDPNAPFIQNEDGTKSTHRMASAEVDGKFVGYPTIVFQNGQLQQLDDDAALKYAMDNNEYREFPTEQLSREWAEGGYKVGTLLDDRTTKARRTVVPPSLGFATGGQVPAAHVVPAENTQRTLLAGAQSGFSLLGNIIPGGGNGVADNIQLNPEGSQPIAISSGEVYVPHNMFANMAGNMGMNTDALASQLYPDGQTANKLPSAASGREIGGPGNDLSSLLLNPNAGAGPREQGILRIGSMSPEATPMQGAKASIQQPDLPDRTPKAATSNVAEGVQPGKRSLMEEEGASGLDRLNRDTSIAQAAMGVGALAYNLFSNRTALPQPKDIPYQPIDLRTDALASELDAQRQTATASSVRNTQDQQGVGRDMAVAAQDQDMRRSNAAQVEGVKNQERQINHAGKNAVDQQNVAQQNAWGMANAQANDAFRLQKGQAVSMALGQLGETAQGYFQNKIDLQVNDASKKANRIFLGAMAGDPQYANMGSADLYSTMIMNSYANRQSRR